MSAADISAESVVATTQQPRRKRLGLSENWWRHLIGLFAVACALFPIWFVLSAAFDRSDSISGTQFKPNVFTFSNFTNILHNTVPDKTVQGGTVDSAFGRWYVNSIVIALVTAVLTVLLGSMTAYAFSRFRFRGRRMGMLFLLLIQMFPQLLLVVAIYLIVLNVGDIFPVIGLNTFTGVIVVYMGGALGVNAWLLKGFFDTIPKELDESARVDGATAGQIFWGVVLPLALPVLAVVGLISFVSTLNEFVIASAILQTKDHLTLPLGMRGFIDQQYGQRWGPFAAGALMAAVPAAILFFSLQKWLVGGLTQGAVKG
jgi:arabinogalactan oligomer/maltooligosaccharide transport system permease protein